MVERLPVEEDVMGSIPIDHPIKISKLQFNKIFNILVTPLYKEECVMEIYVVDVGGSFYKLLTSSNPFQPNCLVKVSIRNKETASWEYLGETVLVSKLKPQSVFVVESCPIIVSRVHYNTL